LVTNGEDISLGLNVHYVAMLAGYSKIDTQSYCIASGVMASTQGKGREMNKPTFLRAAIRDWKNELITAGRLFEIWRVTFGYAYRALLDEEKKWLDIPIERIEQILNECLQKELEDKIAELRRKRE